MYIMGITKSAETKELLINEAPEGNFNWVAQSKAFTCIVRCAAVGGIKTHMTYGLIPSFTENKDLRRYIATPLLQWKLAFGIAVLQKRLICLQKFLVILDISPPWACQI